MAALTITAVNFPCSFACDYIDPCVGKYMYAMSHGKRLACIAVDLKNSLPNDAKVAQVGNSDKKALY